MDATCTIQDSIHVFSLVHKYVSRILGTYHFLLSVVINIAIMIVAVVNPVHDIWYYVATALALASEVIVVLGIIRDYNYRCTRPLPQFNAYKGGQEEIEIS